MALLSMVGGVQFRTKESSVREQGGVTWSTLGAQLCVLNGKRPLTPDEQTRLLAHLKNSGRARDFLFVLTGLRTGYRARELLSIQIKHAAYPLDCHRTLER